MRKRGKMFFFLSRCVLPSLIEEGDEDNQNLSKTSLTFLLVLRELLFLHFYVYTSRSVDLICLLPSCSSHRPKCSNTTMLKTSILVFLQLSSISYINSQIKIKSPVKQYYISPLQIKRHLAKENLLLQLYQ